SIESLRPMDPPRVDLRKLRMNWDNIAFTDREDKLNIIIDEDVYTQYLRLKVLDWSDKGIMRELGMTRPALEVANARLMNEREVSREQREARALVEQEDAAQALDAYARDQQPEPGEGEADEEPEEEAEEEEEAPAEDPQETAVPVE